MDGRKLFIRMAIFKRDRSINCSHVVRGSAQIALKRCGRKEVSGSHIQFELFSSTLGLVRDWHMALSMEHVRKWILPKEYC